MSNKTVIPDSDFSTTIVDKVTGEIQTYPRYVPPKLNKSGQEVPSAITLVAVPAMRDFDLGVRIKRFQRAPESLQARLDYDADDVDFDNHIDTEDTNPMSVHELRFQDTKAQLRDKQKERIKKADEAKAEKLKADKLAFKALYKSLREEGAIPAHSEPTQTKSAAKEGSSAD